MVVPVAAQLLVPVAVVLVLLVVTNQGLITQVVLVVLELLHQQHLMIQEQ
tara:strand:+ start:361 stop:510 length:150 start_codon:yes stop_codon:yes gene_type:complete